MGNGKMDNPSVTDFKNYFTRDFTYGASASTPGVVTNADINVALDDAGAFINVDLFGTQASYTKGFLFLSAHFLVMNLRAASQGTAGNYNWLQVGKSVGSVSENFQVPERIMANPELAMLSKTYYGSKFLFFILPQLSGQMFTVCGDTLA